MSRQDDFDRIIASLYEATLDDSLWRSASALVDEVCGITGTHLVLVGGNTHPEAKWLFDKPYWRGELREDLGRTYAESYFASDERVPHLLRLPDSHMAHINDVYTDQQLKTSATYNELLRWAGAQDGLNIRLDGPAGIHIFWAFANPTTADGWHSDQIAMIERLLPHVRQFVRVRHALIGADALGASLSGLLDNMMIGVLCLDWRGMIVQANDRARAILRQGDGLIDRAGFLHARLAADDLRLRKLLARSLPRSGGQGASSSISVARAHAKRRYGLHVIPLDTRDAGFAMVGVAALLLIVDPETKPRIDAECVAAVLGLTPAEAGVAVALAEGARTKEIATTTRRAEHTVRELTKRVHVKLDISRRADLVRMVLAVSAAPRT